jgi:hypothetical protein
METHCVPDYWSVHHQYSIETHTMYKSYVFTMYRQLVHTWQEKFN